VILAGLALPGWALWEQKQYTGDARQPSQYDGDPGGRFTPAIRWLPGERVPDTHPRAPPTDLAPGCHLLWAGMYEHDTVYNLTVWSAEAPPTDRRILLGEIEVVAP
jgi:hypothetical protein